MIISKYTKNPVEVEAVQVEKIWFPNIAVWCNGKVSEYYSKDDPTKTINCIEINNYSYGLQVAKINDWIIKWPDGDFTVCPEEYFKYTYTVKE